MMQNLDFEKIRTSKAVLGILPVILGIVTSYVITAVSALLSASVSGVLMFVFLYIFGGIGMLFGLLSVYWLVPLGCIIAHLVAYFIIRHTIKPDSIFRSRLFAVGYCFYFALAPSLIFLADNISNSHSRGRSNIVNADQPIQSVSELAIYLPSRSNYIDIRELGLVVVPYTTDRCSLQCARILSETGVEAVVMHREHRNQERPHPLGHQSYRFTYIEREGCGGHGRLQALVEKDCVARGRVPYSPRRGLYVDVESSSEENLLVTTIGAVLHLRYAEGENVSEIATFRSGVIEPSALLKALRYPFHMFIQAGARGSRDGATFGPHPGTSDGVVLPMYLLLEYLRQKTE